MSILLLQQLVNQLKQTLKPAPAPIPVVCIHQDALQQQKVRNSQPRQLHYCPPCPARTTELLAGQLPMAQTMAADASTEDTLSDK